MPEVSGLEYTSRVFLEEGRAVGSVSADGKTVSEFGYKADDPSTTEVDESEEIAYIDQYTSDEALAVGETMPEVSGLEYTSRVFLERSEERRVGKEGRRGGAADG